MKKDISFNKRADKYDNGLEGKMSHRFYDNLVNAVEIVQNSKVLDVGCGTGTILNRLNKKTPLVGYGIDVSNEMLNNARTKNSAMTFTNGDCGALPFEDNSLDVIVTCMAYHHFSSQESFRKEAMRTLKPSGKLYICVPLLPFVIRKLLNFFFRVSNVAARFYTKDELAAQFIGQGFTVTQHIKDAYVQVLVVQKC